MPLGLKPENVQNYDVIHRELEKKDIESRRKWQKTYGNWFDESDAQFLERVSEMKNTHATLPADTYKYKPVLKHPFNPNNPEQGLFKPNDFSVPKCQETSVCDLPGW